MLSGAVFHTLQNMGASPGGGIAVVKTLWLGSVLLCWYLIPWLLLLDQRLTPIHTAIALFFGNMLLRAMVELGMMFIWHNWHPWYGISHDLFSLLLSLVLAARTRQGSLLISRYLLVMSLLFAVETGFAWYMLNNVSVAQGVAYYVPGSSQHQTILLLTGLVVGILWLYLLGFFRRWLRQFPR